MADRIFYSWQSALPNSTNRGFIEQALEAVVEKIRADETLTLEPVIDRDTDGVAGCPDIAATIFEKIAAAAVFVADVSIINAGSEHQRPTPNPNVLIELGYAVGKLGWSRIVLVANTAFGRLEDLPFDLRQRRVIRYDCTEKTPKADARKMLSRSLERVLREILSVLFPETLVPDLEVAIAHPAVLLPKPQEITHLIYAWDIMVRQPDAKSHMGYQRAWRHCTVRVVSDDLWHATFQPQEETVFLAKVRDAFPDDVGANLEDPYPTGVRVRHSDTELSFDRTWIWASIGDVGIIGMAVSLPIIDAPGQYSLANTAQDVARLLQLAGTFLKDGVAVVWLELAAPEIQFVWQSANVIATAQWKEPFMASKPGKNCEAFVEKMLDEGRLLGEQVAAITGELLHIAVTRVHGERLDRERLVRIAEEALQA
jgi:hypothetical protein